MGGLSGDESMLPKNKDYIIESHYGDYPYKCVAFWGFPALSSSGHIGLCSLDAKRRTDLAHISTIDDFKQIWNSEKARKFRRAIKKDRMPSPFAGSAFAANPTSRTPISTVPYSHRSILETRKSRCGGCKGDEG